MIGRIVSRAAQALLVVWAAATLAFLLLQLAPGDPFTSLSEGTGITPEMRAVYGARLGVGEPIGTQYLRWLQCAAQGDFGWSTSQSRPASEVIADALPNTLLLMSLAFLTSIAAGMAIGAWQGARAGSRGDSITSTLALVAYSVPEFWLALLLLIVFAHGLGWLPPGGMTSDTYIYLSRGDQLADRLEHLVLPLLTLTLVGAAVFSRFQRSSMRETIGEPFVRTARAKGLSESAVRRHAWRAALIPVVTVAGLLLPSLVTGAVLVERIYAWPGLGARMLDGIHGRDYAVVTGVVVVGSAFTALGTFVADLLRTVVDPRLRA